LPPEHELGPAESIYLTPEVIHRHGPATKVVTIDEKPNGITVSTESGERHSADALIGADGLWSTIRPLIVSDGKPIVSGHIAYRAVLPTSEMPERLRWPSMVLWAGNKVHLVHYPLRTAAICSISSPCSIAPSTRRVGIPVATFGTLQHVGTVAGIPQNMAAGKHVAQAQKN
jgi:2-polyprenyl-6-methoxyphenol hydroxylase-like FAD-dependent oxidoreductase